MKTIPPKFKTFLNDNFRVDPYGNVICTAPVLYDRRQCLGAFEVDHIWPHAKGGMTELENLVAVQCAANLHKSEKLVFTATPEFIKSLQCGVSVQEFEDLIHGLCQYFPKQDADEKHRRKKDFLMSVFCSVLYLENKVLVEGNYYKDALGRFLDNFKSGPGSIDRQKKLVYFFLAAKRESWEMKGEELLSLAVTKLELGLTIKNLKDELAKAEKQRDEYKTQVEGLAQLRDQLTQAAEALSAHLCMQQPTGTAVPQGDESDGSATVTVTEAPKEKDGQYLDDVAGLAELGLKFVAIRLSESELESKAGTGSTAPGPGSGSAESESESDSE